MKKLILSVILVVLIAGLIFLPHRLWLENRLEDILEAKGFENVELTIASIGFKSAAIENVSIGGENKLNLKNIGLFMARPVEPESPGVDSRRRNVGCQAERRPLGHHRLGRVERKARKQCERAFCVSDYRRRVGARPV